MSCGKEMGGINKLIFIVGLFTLNLVFVGMKDGG